LGKDNTGFNGKNDGTKENATLLAQQLAVLTKQDVFPILEFNYNIDMLPNAIESHGFMYY
jgi:hypothetical protein